MQMAQAAASLQAQLTLEETDRPPNELAHITMMSCLSLLQIITLHPAQPQGCFEPSTQTALHCTASQLWQ
jgi:hypothetical protein